MRLVIAENAFMARCIAQTLDANPVEHAHHFDVATNTQITWSRGHLLKMAEPEDYDFAWHRWRLEDLPIIPEQWKYTERRGAHDHLKMLQQLHHQATEIVHAGAPDREGQLLVDELLHHLHNDKPVLRLLLHACDRPSIRLSMQQMRDNRDFRQLSSSALARSRADWLFGINLTRVCTLLGRRGGYDGVLSVGRIQLALLVLAVKRDQQIEHFTPEQHFSLRVRVVSQTRSAIHLESVLDQLEVNGQPVNDRATIETLAAQLPGNTGNVLAVVQANEIIPPPLPYTLVTLQADASERFGYSLREINEGCLALYQQHHLISYPRTDSATLPSSLLAEAPAVLETVRRLLPELAPQIQKTNVWYRGAVWRDAGSLLNHGIVPLHAPDVALPVNEIAARLYQMISERYLQQFIPPTVHQRDCMTLALPSCQGEVVVETTPLLFEAGEALRCETASVITRKTQAVARFSESTLLLALNDMLALPETALSKQEHTSTGGEAARAHAIEVLVERGYLLKIGNSLFSTAAARDLVQALPSWITTPEFFAQWEHELQAIADGDETYRHFMANMEQSIRTMIDELRTQPLLRIHTPESTLGLETAAQHECPECHAVLVLRKGKHGNFWGCSRYPECRVTIPDKDGTPDDSHSHVKLDTAPAAASPLCSDCNAVMVLRKGQRGHFWGCSKYPECRHTQVWNPVRDKQ